MFQVMFQHVVMISHSHCSLRFWCKCRRSDSGLVWGNCMDLSPSKADLKFSTTSLRMDSMSSGNVYSAWDWWIVCSALRLSAWRRCPSLFSNWHLPSWALASLPLVTLLVIRTTLVPILPLLHRTENMGCDLEDVSLALVSLPDTEILCMRVDIPILYFPISRQLYTGEHLLPHDCLYVKSTNHYKGSDLRGPYCLSPTDENFKLYDDGDIELIDHYACA